MCTGLKVWAGHGLLQFLDVFALGLAIRAYETRPELVGRELVLTNQLQSNRHNM
jgi:hypothetical protein